MLLDCCKKSQKKFGIKLGGVKKLVTNLLPKNNYVVHFRNLQLII